MSYTNIVLLLLQGKICCCFSYEAWTMCFFLFLFFLRIFENRLLMILFCNVQRTKLFVDSGVNLGGNDSLFSTGGKNSALQTKIWQNFNYQKHSRFKGQLISKGLFLSSILPKKSSWIVFVRFLGELKTPKRHFEINWPLRYTVKYGKTRYVKKTKNYLYD